MGPSAQALGVPGNLNDVDPAHIQTPEERFSTPGQQALTIAEGIGQGLAGPVATGAEAALSAVGVPGLSPQEQEARAQANPIERYGSEIGAFGASALYGVGEAGLLAKIGHAAEDLSGLSKAQKIARLGVSSGAEFAALQTGNEVSRAINQDPNQTLGSAAINIGLSGILGVGLGAGLGSVSPIWRSFTQKAAEDASVGSAPIADGEDHLTQSILKPKEKETFLKGLTKQKDNAPEIKAAGDLIGAPVSVSQTSASDYVQGMDSALMQSPSVAGVMRRQEIDKGFDAVGNVIDRTLGVTDDSTPFQRGQTIKDQIQNTVDQIYQPLKDAYAERASLGQTIDLPDEARLGQYDKLQELSQKFEKASPDTAKVVRDAAEGLLRQDTVSDLDDFVKVLNEQQRAAQISGNHYTANALNQVIDSLDDFTVGQIAKQSKAIQAQGAEFGEAIGNDINASYKALKARYRDFKEIMGDLASDSKLGKKATTYGGIREVLDSIPNEKLVDKMFDPKNFAGLKRLETNFPDVFQTVIQGKKSDLLRLADGNAKKLLSSIDKLSPEVQELMFNQEERKLLDASRTWIDSLPPNVGPSGTPKGTAYMNAVKELAHPTVSGMIDRLIGSTLIHIRDASIKTALRFATPAELEANKTATEYVKNSMDGNKLLLNATKAFFSGGISIPEKLMPTEKNRDKLKEKLDSMNADPQSAIQVGGNIGHYLPNHASAVGTMVANVQNYFNSIKPREMVTAPLDQKPIVSKADETRYNRQLDIAEQPLLILKHAKNGSLQAQDVQTLSAVYPALRTKMAQELSQNMIEHVNDKKLIPYHERQALSMIMGQPLDSTMMFPSVQAIIHANALQETSQSQAAGKAKAHKASGSELSQINKVASLYNLPNEQRQINKGRE